jgi:hypothetical protein
MPRFPRPALLALILLLPAGRSSLGAQVTATDSTYLLQASQAMLDAVTSGDSTVWARYLAPEWFVSDEEGEHIPRAEFLAGLHPLPAGQTGKLTVANPHLAGDRNVVVLSYDALEEHHYYGQLLLTTFHQTDTWVRRGTQWLQLASQATALPQPIPGVPISEAGVRDYLGSYQLTAEIHLVVAFAKGGLVMRREGRPDQALYALDDHLFIRHGVRGFWVFERDSTGGVAELVNWRDNNAVRWRRIP